MVIIMRRINKHVYLLQMVISTCKFSVFVQLKLLFAVLRHDLCTYSNCILIHLLSP